MRRTFSARLGAALATAVLIAVAFIARYRFLTSSPFPLGIDGYYYPIQVRSLLEHGRLFYPNAPLVPLLMLPFAWFTDPIAAAKIVAASGTALMVVPAYLLGRRLSGDRAAALFGASVVVVSAQSFYLSTEFVKEGLGLTLAASCLAALALRADEKGSPARMIAAASLLAACFATHKMAAVLVLMLAAPTLWDRFSGRRRQLVAAIGAAALTAALLGQIAPARFASIADLSLLRGMFTSRPDWALPLLRLPHRTPIVLGHEVWLTVLVALALLGVQAVRRAQPLPPLALALVGLALLLGFPWLDPSDPQGIVFRLRLCAFFALAPLSALLLSCLLDLFDERYRAPLALALGCILLLGHPKSSREAVVFTHPALAQAVEGLKGKLPPDADVATPERHIAFMATWYAGRTVHLRPSDEPASERRFRLLPGAFILAGAAEWSQSPLARALDELRLHPVAGVERPVDLHPLAANGLVLVSERTWEYLLRRLPDDSRRHYESWPTQ